MTPIKTDGRSAFVSLAAVDATDAAVRRRIPKRERRSKNEGGDEVIMRWQSILKKGHLALLNTTSHPCASRRQQGFGGQPCSECFLRSFGPQ